MKEELKMKKTLALLLVLVLVLSLCACGAKEEKKPAKEDGAAATEAATEAGSEEQELSQPFTVGSYQALYTGFELLKNEEGKDAILVKFDFTNNGDKDMAFSYGMYLQLFQGEDKLDYCTIYVDDEKNHAMDDTIIKTVKPGETLAVQGTYTLKDLNTPVRIQFSNNAGEELHFGTLDIAK